MTSAASHSEAQSHHIAPETVRRGPHHLPCFVGQPSPLPEYLVREQSHQSLQEGTAPIPHCADGKLRDREPSLQHSEPEAKGTLRQQRGSLSQGWISKRHQNPMFPQRSRLAGITPAQLSQEIRPKTGSHGHLRGTGMGEQINGHPTKLPWQTKPSQTPTPQLGANSYLSFTALQKKRRVLGGCRGTTTPPPAPAETSAPPTASPHPFPLLCWPRLPRPSEPNNESMSTY